MQTKVSQADSHNIRYPPQTLVIWSMVNHILALNFSDIWSTLPEQNRGPYIRNPVYPKGKAMSQARGPDATPLALFWFNRVLDQPMIGLKSWPKYIPNLKVQVHSNQKLQLEGIFVCM